MVATTTKLALPKGEGGDNARDYLKGAISGGGLWTALNTLDDAIVSTIVDAKGDLLVGSAADTVVRKAVGADNTVLVADSAQTGGITWSATLAGLTLTSPTVNSPTLSSPTVTGNLSLVSGALLTDPGLVGVKLGGTASRSGTAGTSSLHIFDGTTPVGTLANGVTFYSVSGEARVLDAAGNSTLLSPHSEDGRWIHEEVNAQGRYLRVDMEGLVKALDALVGGGYIAEAQVDAGVELSEARAAPAAVDARGALRAHIASLATQVTP